VVVNPIYNPVANVTSKVTVNGTNTAQQINNINITCDDIYALDRLIDFDGHTINGLVCAANNTSHSFATSMIRGTNLKNSVIGDMSLRHRVDSSVPTIDGECIGKVVDLLGDAENNVISGNTIKNLRENIIHVRGNSIGNIITDNSLQECFSRSNNATERVLCLFEGAIRTGNIIRGNTATSSVYSGTFKQTNIPLASLGLNIVKDNLAPWTWADAAQTAYVSVFAGATDITASIANNNRICRFTFNGDYIEGVLALTVDTSELGAITASLPVASVTELPTVSSAFGGHGIISSIIGFNTVGYVPSPIYVNAATDKFEFFGILVQTIRLLIFQVSGRRRLEYGNIMVGVILLRPVTSGFFRSWCDFGLDIVFP